MTGGGESSDVVHAARYIPLPGSLWSLRHRFPTVTRSVLLQCVRCHRWVAQPVTSQPPDEVPMCPTRSEWAARFPGDRQRRERQQGGKEESRDEWRSPRLRQHYEKIVDVAKQGKQCHHNEEEEGHTYFIPNPANFTCQWIYCTLEDVWADLREQWLGELYTAMDCVKGNEKGSCGAGSSLSKSIRQRGPLEPQQQRLNEELTKELHGRRSERLARKPQGGVDLKNETYEPFESAAEPSHSGRVTQHLNTLIHNDAAVVASFCWISCDCCGKLRRVHQPFPGGAPFVCSLALNIGSCSVPEEGGLSPIFRDEGTREFANGKAESFVGDVALREVVEAEVSAAAVAGSAGRRSSRAVATGPRHMQRGSASLMSGIPLLRDLTSALRKRALGVFVKNVMRVPDEVRAKREEVVRASLVVAEGGSHADSLSPKREIAESERQEMHSSDAYSSPSQPHQQQCELQQQQQQQREEGSENDRAFDLTQRAETHRVATEAPAHGGEAPSVEAPRRGRRLGCPPRPAPWQANAGVAQPCTSAQVVSPRWPADTVTRHNAPPQPPAAVKLETATEPHGAVDGTSSHNDWRNGNSMKREEPEVVPAPLPQPPPSPLTTTTAAAAVTPVVEEPFVVNSSKETRGRKRTRHDSAPDAVEEKKTNKNSSVANDFGVRRRGRPPRNAGNSDTTAPTKKKKGDVIHWVCCDLCSKWRIVPEKIPADTAEWHCVMRADGTTCSDTDDEVRMNHSKKKR